MSITSIGPGSLAEVGALPLPSSSTPSPTTASQGSGGTVSISPRSHFLAQLQSRMQSDPAGAASMVSSLAATMRGRAAGQTGEPADRTSALAARLETAVRSGNLSSLFGGGPSSSGAATSGYSAMASTRSS